MNYILFDTNTRVNLQPLTLCRTVADIRIGILTIREKWEKYLGKKTSSLTENYLSKKYPLLAEKQNILINASVCPSSSLVAKILELKTNQAIFYKNEVIALNTKSDVKLLQIAHLDGFERISYEETLLTVKNTWDVFAKNGDALKQDFELLITKQKSNISDTVIYTGPKENIFIHPSATVNHAILNASYGPIYLDENSEIMEGAMIRGPFYLGKNSTVKMGAKIYGPTTIGPHSKVGGELNNVVMFGSSNKGHDGYLGNAVIAEWCNIGAATNNSNLKNTYDNVKIWSYETRTFVNTQLQFCGLIMGDHSKTGINTMFNTGAVVGIASNLFGTGFQRNFIPSFSWGGPTKMIKHNFKRAVITAEHVYKRRNLEFSEIDKKIFAYLFEQSQTDSQL